ncbi:MAG TPA: radical SAM protein, partial [Chitinivibrionales bacterium]
MRIALYYPRGSTYSPKGNDLHRAACVMPPIGLAVIAAVLRDGGHTVRIIDAALRHTISNDRWVSEIVNWKPDLVGFSAITSNFLDAYEVCEKIKTLAPSIITVFGGVHVSWGRESVLQNFEAVDIILTGEGEQSLSQLASGAPLGSIPGAYFRNGPLIEKGPDQTRLCDMDSLPFPAYDLLDGFPRTYLLPLFSYPAHPVAGVISSRGCLHQCSYCDRSVFGKSFRWNSPEYTMEHIARLKGDFGVRHINFYDDQFATNPTRVIRLCELLQKSKMRVSFNCTLRLGHIDSSLCSLLKSAGCWMVNVGIESGDQGLLNLHKSGLTLETITKDVRMLHHHGLYVKGLFMMGLPGETEETLRKTRNFALSLPLKDANMTAFTPFPGAPITPKITEYGALQNHWPSLDCEHFMFVPRGIPSREFLEKQLALFITSFYQRPFMRHIYVKMIFQSPHSFWRLLKNAGV